MVGVRCKQVRVGLGRSLTREQGLLHRETAVLDLVDVKHLLYINKIYSNST